MTVEIHYLLSEEGRRVTLQMTGTPSVATRNRTLQLDSSHAGTLYDRAIEVAAVREDGVGRIHLDRGLDLIEWDHPPTAEELVEAAEKIAREKREKAERKAAERRAGLLDDLRKWQEAATAGGVVALLRHDSDRWREDEYGMLGRLDEVAGDDEVDEAVRLEAAALAREVRAEIKQRNAEHAAEAARRKRERDALLAEAVEAAHAYAAGGAAPSERHTQALRAAHEREPLRKIKAEDARRLDRVLADMLVRLTEDPRLEMASEARPLGLIARGEAVEILRDALLAEGPEFVPLTDADVPCLCAGCDWEEFGPCGGGEDKYEGNPCDCRTSFRALGSASEDATATAQEWAEVRRAQHALENVMGPVARGHGLTCTVEPRCHVGTRDDCDGRAHRWGVLVRLDLGGGVSIEREYAAE